MRNGRISDEMLAAADRAGITVASRLRGVHVCCEVDGNIEFDGVPVSGEYDPNNPEHLQNMMDSLQPCWCRKCGTRYFAHSDLRDAVLMVHGTQDRIRNVDELVRKAARGR